VIVIAKHDDCNVVCNNGYEMEKTTKFCAAHINKREVVENELKEILYCDRDVNYVHSYKNIALFLEK